MPINIKSQDLYAIIDSAIKEHGERDLKDGTYGPTVASGTSITIPSIQITSRKVASIGNSNVQITAGHCSYCSYCSYCNAQCRQCANCKTIQCNVVQCHCDCNCNCDGCID